MTNFNRCEKCCTSKGFSLVELLVALTISSFIVFGATQVYVDSRNTYVIHETTARLQETARYALSVIEPDVRMANYWGLFKGAQGASGSALQTAAASTLVAGMPVSCGNNFAVDATNFLQASNASYPFGCAAFGAGAVATADTLTVRRAAVNTSAVPSTTAGPLRICSSRLFGVLFRAATPCAAAPTGRVNDLIVNAYYVDRDSAQAAGTPSLRRKSLNATPSFQDDEIVAGVEDMQVQFGIDFTGTSGVASQYVNAPAIATLPVTAQIVSVRIWLLVRSDTQERGFVDTRTYFYGNRTAGTTTSLAIVADANKGYRPADTFRRLLVSRTIMIRNALGT